MSWAFALPALLAAGRTSRLAAQGTVADDAVSTSRAFFEHWAAKAKELVAQNEPNEERFVHLLCAALAEVDPEILPKRRFTVFDDAGMRTGPVGNDDVLQVVEIEVDPGVVIPTHNHVGYDFVSLCVAGSAHVRHFEPLPDAPPASSVGEELVVREVSSAWLTPGRTTSLTRTRANLHTFTAGDEGCTLLDFGVKHPDPGQGPRHFSVCAVGEPVAAEQRTFRARWRGNIYAKNVKGE